MNKKLGVFLLIICSSIRILFGMEDDFNETTSSSSSNFSPIENICGSSLKIANVKSLSNQGNVIVHVHSGARIVINNYEVVENGSKLHFERSEKQKKGQSNNSTAETNKRLALIIANSRRRRTPDKNPSFIATGKNIQLLHRMFVKGSCR